MLSFLKWIALCWSLSAFASGGVGIGNGGDDVPNDYSSAWFLGATHPIHVCYQVSADFGANSDAIEGAIRFAFETWQTYVDQKKINVEAPIALDFAIDFLPSCNGQEDLAFYLGVTNEATAAAAKLFINPLAFAYRQTYDQAKGWGKGFVWVGQVRGSSPVHWSNEGALRSIFLHEVGHVLGCNHVDDTIMRADIAGAILQGQMDGESYLSKNLARIDQDHELYLCQIGDCAIEAQAPFEPNAYHLFSRDTPKLDWNSTAILKRPRKNFDDENQSTDFQLVFKSVGKELGVPIKVLNAFVQPGAAKLFQRTLNGNVRWSSAGDAETYIATAKLATGETIPVSIERNAGKGGLRVIAYPKNGATPLFQSGSSD